ncbi:MULTISPECIES: glycosyltransferase [unclassified Aureimonas]|uniref:glycosyltransferase n=1 Tax=unclassified Aureimonas TaxID=2615206 RepID=UPI0009EB3DFB|nr:MULTISPECIES: glycosyltransferase [unclassified Aureimonas]
MNLRFSAEPSISERACSTADEALALSAVPSIVVIGDLVEGWPPRQGRGLDVEEAERYWREAPVEQCFGPVGDPIAARETLAVVGGYLERLPLACVSAGLVDHAEIWHHWRGEGPGPFRRDGQLLARRAFRIDEEGAPFASSDMLGFLRAHGAPHILVVLGLGVDEAVLRACGRSFKIYNSIDAPALRVPPEVSRHFDLVLTGAEWQSEAVRARHPDMATEIMPIGPEFADPETFRPLGTAKDYDLVYVAAAQGYKRHDILFDALERLPRSIRALCVFGYGEMAEDLKRQADERGLSVDVVGPPGVPFAEVNALMNRARIGLVCGVDDGAPAIITEYMLAGLPVLANERLSCGLQFITPETGRTAPAEGFADAITDMLADLDRFRPREISLERWVWPHTVARLTASVGPT